MKRRIKLSLICFSSFAVGSVIGTVTTSPLFGNFTAERLPGLLVVGIIVGLVWGFIGGTVFRIP